MPFATFELGAGKLFQGHILPARHLSASRSFTVSFHATVMPHDLARLISLPLFSTPERPRSSDPPLPLNYLHGRILIVRALSGKTAVSLFASSRRGGQGAWGRKIPERKRGAFDMSPGASPRCRLTQSQATPSATATAAPFVGNFAENGAHPDRDGQARSEARRRRLGRGLSKRNRETIRPGVGPGLQPYSRQLTLKPTHSGR